MIKKMIISCVCLRRRRPVSPAQISHTQHTRTHEYYMVISISYTHQWYEAFDCGDGAPILCGFEIPEIYLELDFIIFLPLLQYIILQSLVAINQYRSCLRPHPPTVVKGRWPMPRRPVSGGEFVKGDGSMRISCHIFFLWCTILSWVYLIEGDTCLIDGMDLNRRDIICPIRTCLCGPNLHCFARYRVHIIFNSHDMYLFLFFYLYPRPWYV